MVFSFFLKFFDFLSFGTSIHVGYFWNVGFCLFFFLCLQIVTGLFLSCYYEPNIEKAFDSIMYILKEVKYGWMVHHAHGVGASFMFFFLYVHILSSFLFSLCGNFLVWVSGVFIFILCVMISFLGYSLPMGSMSYWAMVVVVNFFSVLPFFSIVKGFMLGSSCICSYTLKSFFVFHFLLSILLFFLVLMHVLFLHFSGSSSGFFDTYKCLSFYPFMFFKDLYFLIFVIIIFVYFVFFDPYLFYSSVNFVRFDPLVTPDVMEPEWYLLPFFVLLKSFDSKGFGLLMLFFCFFGLFFSVFSFNYHFLTGYDWSRLFFCFLFVFMFIFYIVKPFEVSALVMKVMGLFFVSYFFGEVLFFVFYYLLSYFFMIVFSGQMFFILWIVFSMAYSNSDETWANLCVFIYSKYKLFVYKDRLMLFILEGVLNLLMDMSTSPFWDCFSSWILFFYCFFLQFKGCVCSDFIFFISKLFYVLSLFMFNCSVFYLFDFIKFSYLSGSVFSGLFFNISFIHFLHVVFFFLFFMFMLFKDVKGFFLCGDVLCWCFLEFFYFTLLMTFFIVMCSHINVFTFGYYNPNDLLQWF